MWRLPWSQKISSWSRGSCKTCSCHSCPDVPVTASPSLSKAWSYGRWWPGLMNHVFFYITWMAGCVCVAYLGNTWYQDALWEECKPAEAVWRFGQCSAGKPWVTCLSIVADHVYLFMETVFPRGLFQQDNSLPQNKNGSGMFWAQQRVWGVKLATKFSRSQSNRASVGCTEPTSLIHDGGPTSQLTGLKGSAANLAHLQGSHGVHASMGQGYFDSKMGINRILAKWS